MNCDKTEKISEMIDGELSPEETEELSQHIENCAWCESARNDFLFFREQIKSLAEVSPSSVRANTEPVVWKRFFKKRLEISFPVPVFALSLVIMSVLGLWAWSASRAGSLETSPAESKNQIQKNSSSDSKNMAETSLARFDGGGRAEIYTIKNQPADNNAGQRGEVK